MKCKILNCIRCRTQEKSHPKDPAAVAYYSKRRGRFEYVEDKGFEIITVVQNPYQNL
jgi:hypothetical protein